MLDINYVSEQGKRFYPITHRLAIVGLATNTLVLSESVDIDVDINADGEPITINPVVQTEITKLSTNITNITIGMDQVNAVLKTKANSDTNGIANSAHKLQTARRINITGSVTGNAYFNGENDITINLATNHTHNYAGSSSAGGNANAAVKLATARKIGNANFDGTANITVAAIGAAAASHTHNYAGSSSAGGNANAAVKLATARNIALRGVVTGNANFDGSGNINIDTVFGSSSTYLPLTGGTLSGSLVSNNIQANGRYYQGGTVGMISATQSGAPDTNMLWAW